MATVPHTPAPCEPLTTLMAACWGFLHIPQRGIFQQYDPLTATTVST
jgi:hypothetical protein